MTVLHHFSNVDKHRALHVAAGFLYAPALAVWLGCDGEPSVEAGNAVKSLHADAGMLDNGAQVVWFDCTNEQLDSSDVRVQRQGSAYVRLKEAGPFGEHYSLEFFAEDLLHHVRDEVLPNFVPLF